MYIIMRVPYGLLRRFADRINAVAVYEPNAQQSKTLANRTQDMLCRIYKHFSVITADSTGYHNGGIVCNPDKKKVCARPVLQLIYGICLHVATQANSFLILCIFNSTVY